MNAATDHRTRESHAPQRDEASGLYLVLGLTVLLLTIALILT